MRTLLGMPEMASHHGAKVDSFIFYVHYLMLALFVGWLSYLIYTLIRFRKSQQPKASYVGATSHASTYVEMGVVFVEAILLLGFAIPLWANFADKFPKPAESVQVRVIAEQFAWNFLYPGPDGQFGKRDLALVSGTNPYGIDHNDPASKDDYSSALNEFYAVQNKPVIASISSKDVIHSFKVNTFRVCQDAIPGMMVPIWFVPTAKGKHVITCAQLCGNSHYFMKGFVNVVSQEEFDTWAAERVAANAAAAGGFE